MRRIILLFLISVFSIRSQTSGCTDPLSKNYNPKSIQNNGSCIYENIKIKPKYSKKLSDSVRETSGLIAFDNLFWTHNDDHDKTIYGLDSLGKIRKKIVLEKAVNHDWEEISQDSLYVYIGDFGNNFKGNRKDLNILKIEKKSFLEQNPVIEKISFLYADQNDFSAQSPNSTDFDCEAFIVSKDSIYLFSKQWKSSKTNIYVLPNQPGNYIAKFKETLDTKGLVTGAVFFEKKKILALCGYSKTGRSFLYLLYDFKNNAFLSGNKRKIDLKLPFHQIEGITTKDGLHYFITNESLVRKPILNTQQQIHYLDLSSLLTEYINRQ
ncbi:hypothetical protein [Flavobacterium defluvii]|uniref:T9SS C-terminal target domain-containing protein n=1 Tax=Flavobacterium defluvii TaxID=370979 RepID=A0A1M5SDV8_9FLAO|nr:hypothetical protein [Flavobacterium defluvii]SHH36651.1 hypothetical protein SAMN05443663_10785 [Flavobacterium defluvii]